MSAERHHEHQERHERVHEQLEQARQEKLAELRRNAEHAPDDAEQRAEAAREVIHQQDKAPEPEQPTPENHEPKHRLQHVLDYNLNFAHTMTSVQRRLSPVSRSFSKVIHTPAVEKTSEALERTVARPSVMAGATWTALIVGGVFYVVARSYGYSLSGSELLFSFLVGAIIGLGLEGVWRTLRRR